MNANFLIDILFLPIIIFICIITSLEDLKEGKIKNKWIKLGFFWGIFIYFFFFFLSTLNIVFSSFFPQKVYFLSYSYLFKVLINSSFALILSFLLWYFRLWSAGDAKLFFVISFLLPLKYYWKSYLPWFPSFALLINIFFPAFIFFLLHFFFHFFHFVFKIFRERKEKGKFIETLGLNFLESIFSFKNFIKNFTKERNPFALWVFFGTIFTLILKGSIIPVLIKIDKTIFFYIHYIY